MQRFYKCQTCGLDKTLESKKKDGTTFMSCPNWKDEEHKKAREDWKKLQGAPQGTYNAKNSPSASLSNNPDVYDLLTTVVAKVNAIWDKLNKEMPDNEEF